MFQFMSCIMFSILSWQRFITVNIFVISIYYLARTVYRISKVVDDVMASLWYIWGTAMTLWTWMRSFMILVDMFLGHRHTRRKHRNNKHHCPRYYIRHIKGKSSRARWRRSQNQLHVFYTFASQKITTTNKNLRKDAHQVHFDSDSFIIGIDNHASRSISNNIDHFTTAL
jgi:hypothetical protein